MCLINLEAILIYIGLKENSIYNYITKNVKMFIDPYDNPYYTLINTCTSTVYKLSASSNNLI